MEVKRKHLDTHSGDTQIFH